MFLVFSITVIRVNQWSDFAFSDHGDVARSPDLFPDPCHPCKSVMSVWFSILVITRFWQFRRSPVRPTPHFSTFVANKTTCSIRPKGDPCVTLGWPRRDPWVTQSQSQTQSHSAEGRNSKTQTPGLIRPG